MKRVENDCCGCATDSYPCRGSRCPLTHVEHFYCDKCGSEDKLHEYGGKELCAECLLEAVPVVEGSDKYD